MINKILEAMVATLLLATVAVAFLAVVYRYLLDNALSWSFEVSLALLTYITFLGSYLALRRGAHLKVDILVKLLPAKGQVVLFAVNQSIIGSIGALMAYHGWRQVSLFNQQTTNVLEISSGYYYAAIPVAGALICLDAVVQLISGLRLAAHGQALPDRSEPDDISFDI